MAEATAKTRTPEMDDWVLSIEPTLANVLGAAAAPAPGRANPPAAEVEAVTMPITEFPCTAYATVKLQVSVKMAVKAEGTKSDSATTSKDKSSGRETGVKSKHSLASFRDQGFLAFDFTDVSGNIEGEISGSEVSASLSLSAKVKAPFFTAPASASAKLIVLKYSEKDGFSLPAVDLKIAPVLTKTVDAGVETTVTTEFKATVTANKKAIVEKIGKKVFYKLAEKVLEKAAEKAGVKFLTREAASAVLKDLGPLAAAFSVGLDIGEILNAYTIAPEVAGAVDDAILGDLNEEYQRADTLGKMWLLHKNAPRIAAALIASGIAGTVAGFGDLVLFKLFKLDRLKDYAEALGNFLDGITELAHGVKQVADSFAASIYFGAFAIGIKCNPKHHKAANASIDKILAAVFAKIKPLYPAGRAADVGSVTIGAANPDAKALADLAGTIELFGITGEGIDTSSHDSILASLKALSVKSFLNLLEAHHLVTFTVTLPNNLDPDAIDQKLLDELAA